VDGICLAAGMVARVGSINGGGGCGQWIWWKLGGLQKWTMECLKEIVSGGV
jgi:hypothetical protein